MFDNSAQAVSLLDQLASVIVVISLICFDCLTPVTLKQQPGRYQVCVTLTLRISHWLQ